MDHSCTLPADEIERIARRRTALRLGWYAHALVFIAVNAMLVALAAVGDRHWSTVPALGWGTGLAIHGFVVFLLTGGAGLQQRLLDQERRRLAAQRDPW